MGVRIGKQTFTHGDKTLDSAGWAAELDLTESYFRFRIRTKPESEWFLAKNESRERRLIEIDGVSKTAQEWSAESGVPESTIWYRVRNGKKDGEIIAPSKIKMPPKTVSKKEVKQRLFGQYEDVQTEDLELARRLQNWRDQGLGDEEILIKHRTSVM